MGLCGCDRTLLARGGGRGGGLNIFVAVRPRRV